MVHFWVVEGCSGEDDRETGAGGFTGERRQGHWGLRVGLEARGKRVTSECKLPGEETGERGL